MADPLDMLSAFKALVETVPDLKGRVDEALDLAALLKTGQVPNRHVSGWVIPSGLRPRSHGDASAGAYTQMVDEHFALVLALRSGGDATGGKLAPRLNELVWAVIGAVVGADPSDAVPGVFRLVGGQTLSLSAGLVTYQLDVALQLQLRTM